MDRPASRESVSRDRSRLLILVAVGFFMQTLDSTIVNTALPSMARTFGESPLRMQSVVISYALTMALLIPASGWLADRFGIRRIYLVALGLFVLGSLFCAASRTLTMLVCSRVLQAVGGAMLLPVGRLSLLKSTPREQFLQAMSFVAIPGMVGPLIGPTLGGWLAQVASWHWIFLINVPFGLVAAVATERYMPDERARDLGRFDLGGYFLMAFGMASISLSLDGLAEFDLRHAAVTVLLVFGLASIAAYWLHANGRAEPLFSPRLLETRTYSIGLLGNLFARIGSGSMPYLVPLLLQVSLGFSPLRAGLMMVPVALAAIAVKRIVTPVIHRFGYRRVLVTNTLLVGLAIASFTFVNGAEPAWLRAIQLAFFGAVNSLQFTAMNTIALKDLPREQASSGNGLLSVVQMLSMSLGVAVAGALLATFTTAFAHEANANALAAFQATFVCVGIITCASAWIFWQLPRDVRSTRTAEAPIEVG